MKIAFLSLLGVFDYYQIGGTDSYLRRLSNEIIKQDDSIEIDWVFYQSPKSIRVVHNRQLRSIYLGSFNETLHYLEKGNFNHIVATYLNPIDRIKFVNFRARHSNTILFHNIVFFYPTSIIKRLIKFSEFMQSPYNGTVFCVSKRILKEISRINTRAIYLPPPIPNDYYVSINDKPIQEKIQVTFLGRIDPRKGIKEVIDLIVSLENNNRFIKSIYGIHIPTDHAGLELHNWLSNQDLIDYYPISRHSYSEKIDQNVRNILRSTDIFLQPYTTLESTVDTPLLLLEAMASLCVILTTRVGDIPGIYQSNRYIFDIVDFKKRALDIISHIDSDQILSERIRINKLNNEMLNRSNLIAQRFLDAISRKI